MRTDLGPLYSEKAALDHDMAMRVHDMLNDLAALTGVPQRAAWASLRRIVAGLGR